MLTFIPMYIESDRHCGKVWLSLEYIREFGKNNQCEPVMNHEFSVLSDQCHVDSIFKCQTCLVKDEVLKSVLTPDI